MSTTDLPLWFGKLASLGDFAHRRAPAHWLQCCDVWLSASMRTGQDLLQERWLAAYLQAQVLRFAWAPGVVDPQWWFGLLMPSCDNVGRYFPLLIAQPRPRPPEDEIALNHLELWFEHLSTAALQTLDGAADAVQTLEVALQGAPPWPTAGHGAARPVARGDGDAQWTCPRPLALAEWLHNLAAGELVRRLDGCTLWWRAGGGRGLQTVDLVHGLPQGRRFIELILESWPDEGDGTGSGGAGRGF